VVDELEVPYGQMGALNPVASQVTFFFGVGRDVEKWTETWKVEGLEANDEYARTVQHLRTVEQYAWCVEHGELVGSTRR
jgi:hypothetical protein